MIEKLAEQGLLGLLLALAIVAIVFLHRENKSLQEKRVEDARTIRQDLMEPMKAIREAIETLTVMVKQDLQQK